VIVCKAIESLGGHESDVTVQTCYVLWIGCT